MSILDLPRTYGHLKRFREIVVTLARHGFSHVLGQLRLSDYIPGLARMTMAIRDKDDATGRLSTAERLAHVLQDLGATFIKFGQLMATRPDLIPPAYVDAFAKLQDSVQPVPGEQIQCIIEARLGKPVGDLFKIFSDTPIASGSIGQVHEATLENGTLVVIKVKRPDTDSRVREDLELLSALAGLVENYLPELAIFRPRMIVEEFSRSMEHELDFVGEASYAGKFEQQFAADADIQVPLVHWDFVTRDTLVFDRMAGLRLTDIAALDEKKIDRKDLAQRVGRCFLRQYFESGFFHADPHPGNLLVQEDGTLCLLDFGQVGHLSDELRRQLALTLIALSQGDTDSIVDLYAEIGVFTERTNLREFKSELARLVDRYYGVPVNKLDMRDAFHEALSVARRNGLFLPRDFVMLGKSLVTVLGVIRQLDPDFRFDGVVRPFLRDVVTHLFAPKTFVKRLGFYAYRILSLVRRAPEDMRDLIEKAKSGQMRIIFQHDGLDPVVGQLERAANRLTLGIIIAALTVGSAIVFSAGDQALGTRTLPLVGEAVPVSAICAAGGFLAALGMGLYLAWGIFRSKRL